MNPRIPEPVRPVLEEYVSLLNQQFPELVFSVDIVGSIALGEYNEQFSDIDFVTLHPRRLTDEEVRKLQLLHHRLKRKYPKHYLSGSYFQPCDLGRLDGFTQPHPHYHDGKLDPQGLTKISPVTWWELKHHGIPVVGDEPCTLPFTMDWDRVLSTMMENLNTYWNSWTTRPRRILVLYSDWGIQWAVTGVLRQFYSLREKDVTTKVKAAGYALDHVPARWHPIIQEAIRIRENKNKSEYQNRVARILDAVGLLKFIIQTSNVAYSEMIHNR